MNSQVYRVDVVGGDTVITLNYRFRWYVIITYLTASAFIVFHVFCRYANVPNSNGHYVLASLAVVATLLIALQVAFALKPEKIVISGNALTIEHRLRFIGGRHESFEIRYITNLRIGFTRQKRKNNSQLVREIIFDYQGREVRFGRDLSEETANALMGGPLKQVLRFEHPVA
jgi:hypothetical protein